MSDIQEEQKRLYKIAEENDLMQIPNKIIENTILIKQTGDKVINKMNELQEENKKLKELCDKYEEEHKTTFIEWQKDIKANKKAIEYINKYKNQNWYIESRFTEELLNILQGEQNE